ncbi:MAG: hypothetical protein F4103_16270 [Boseongicola sp. SB0673_bin_14]|nr:hypothetical protein [Boseongicola sp. SB0667_bin_21]MYI70219.1 hypothetical protein [Boseongicola sp. SB0673_bin_14]
MNLAWIGPVDEAAEEAMEPSGRSNCQDIGFRIRRMVIPNGKRSDVKRLGDRGVSAREHLSSAIDNLFLVSF